MELLDELAASRVLGGFLSALHAEAGTYELLAHWQQGEFHHDVIVRFPRGSLPLPSDTLIVATNCNGGIKEILCVAEIPERWGLWHHRCPDNPEFSGPPPLILKSLRTEHWFDPCALLLDDARSELKPEYRTRAKGGGWKMVK